MSDQNLEEKSDQMKWGEYGKELVKSFRDKMRGEQEMSLVKVNGKEREREDIIMNVAEMLTYWIITYIIL